MILKKLSEFIIVDDIRREANASELYFLSHLMDHDMLTLPDSWPGRIYTSKFIFDVMSQKKPYIKMNFFRTLLPNVPVKFKSKDKTIIVTMFETGEITHNVMFHFEDNNTTHLYTGVFTEVCHLNLNKHFKEVLDKGIDYIYIDTTRCKGKSFIFTDDAVEEISQIYTQNPNKSIAMIIPDYGYEAILASLLEKLPQKVYPTSNQRKMLARLGYGQLIGISVNSPIKIYPPGITAGFIQSSDLLTIYLAEGKSSTSACGIQICQWSPFPSVMNLQELLEMTRPTEIIPIRKVPLEEKVSLPASFKFFLGPKRRKEVSQANLSSAGDSTLESQIGGESIKSEDSDYDPVADSTSALKTSNPRKSKEKIDKVKTPQPSTPPQQEKVVSATSTGVDNKESGVPKNRTRVIRRPQDFEYEDSDE